MTTRPRSATICAAAFLILLGCAGPTAPANLDPDRLHAELPDMDPADLRIGSVLMTHCTYEWREPPDGHVIIVDLYLAGSSSEYPGPEVAARVERFGGEILHRFNAPILRVQVPTDRVVDLMRAGGLAGPIGHVRSVPDLERRDVHVGMLLDRPVTDEDLDGVARLGGQVRSAGINTPFVYMHIPDASVPQLEASEGFVTLVAAKQFCLGA